MSRHALVRAGAAPVVLLSLLLAGCSIPRTLRIDDDSATTYAARGVVRLGSRQVSGIEVGYSQFRAEDTQTLPAGARVTLDSVSVVGPVELRNRARMQVAHVAYNHLFFATRPVQMELLGGAAVLRLAWRAQPLSGMQFPIDKQVDRGGFFVGVGPRWKFADRFALEGRLATVSTLRCRDDCGHLTTADVALAFYPFAQMRLRAGYFESEGRFEHGNDFESAIALRARGPRLDFVLEF
ncbi:MAG TPA: hypothetical protein VFR86_15380 [Burkholderiaceae bacterium]|nr:hypothetical protein [Burkholderiaceae bacterium]